ncbi:VOC family protein [Pseudonocardia sp. C8]|uniref:VOC family protein n=1 Tax=Pseudonocardia sp. C8 TaxID=2762759 RepID=UPI0016431748|nr:VOC family protein [Pseudonocardia sp. C8]MBC3193538.1 VOC family protein [Pseudonocardia sp. C8]
MGGRVVHFEIPFDDGDRARAFYRDAFGWNVQEMPEFSYTMAATGPATEQGMPSEPGFINGGMFARSEEWPAAGPVIVVDVESIDDTMARLTELGATSVVDKQPVGEMGFAAYFRDPEGNVIGLWESAAA